MENSLLATGIGREKGRTLKIPKNGISFNQARKKLGVLSPRV